MNNELITYFIGASFIAVLSLLLIIAIDVFKELNKSIIQPIVGDRVMFVHKWIGIGGQIINPGFNGIIIEKIENFGNGNDGTIYVIRAESNHCFIETNMNLKELLHYCELK